MPEEEANPNKKMPARQYIAAILNVTKISFQIAPKANLFKLFGIALKSGLPIITTYYAAQTTTKLTEAFAGNTGAGKAALAYVAITALLGLITTFWGSIDSYIQQVMRYQVDAKISDQMYEHFLSLEFWRYDDKETVDIYERAQKFSRFFAYVLDRVGDAVSQLIGLFFALVALAVTLPWVALAVLAAVAPGLYIQFKISRSQIDHWNKNVEARRSISYIEWDLLQPKAITELRLYGLVRYFLNLRNKLREKDEKGRLDFERKYIFKRLASDVIEALVELGSLLWITLQIISQKQPVGQFIYVQQLVSRAITNANGFVNQISSMDEDLANLVDYQKFMQLPKAAMSGNKLSHAPEFIALNNISFKYPQSNKFVIKEITLKINKGQHVAIVGENGAGKSTLIKIITGLYKPVKGDIYLGSQNMAQIDINSWQKHISVLSQEFETYGFTNIKNNIYFGNVAKPLNEKLLVTAMKDSESYDFIQQLPKKELTLASNWMEDDAGNKGVELSGGQWQRIALARNFYRNAPIIILDEPTSAIDALAESRIFKKLFSTTNDKTVITISHRLSTIEKADVIFMLKDGHIAENGSYTQLVANKGAFYKMFESQIKK